jgi:hypothetical protein
MPVAGLAVGRVVHFTPKPDWCPALGILPGDPIGGRVSRIEDPHKGTITIHLDTLSGVSEAQVGRMGSGCTWVRADGDLKLVTDGFQTVATGVPFDESGKPGTWRYPPRV